MRENGEREVERTNFNGSDAKPAGLEDETDTAGGDAFAKAANNSSGHQHVLHFSSER